MSAGPMPMRRSAALVMALLAGPVGAGPVAVPADCAELAALIEGVVGSGLTVPPSAAKDGWCVLDGARSFGGEVRVSAEVLRVRGEVLEDRLVALEVEGAGLRVAPALNNRDMAGWLRDLMRLQSADLQLTLRRDEAQDVLRIERGFLGLSGGGELDVTGTVAGADLSASSLLIGRVTTLTVEWLNDGRTLRPLLEAMGGRLQPGATGTEAVLAARAALQGAVAAVPVAALAEGDAEAAEAVIAALPQGRGRVTVGVASDGGIGAAQLGLLALAEDPTGPESLARFFAGSRVTVAWAPGLSP